MTRLATHVKHSPNYNRFQSAYRRGHSTETAILRMLNDAYCMRCRQWIKDNAAATRPVVRIRYSRYHHATATPPIYFRNFRPSLELGQFILGLPTSVRSRRERSSRLSSSVNTEPRKALCSYRCCSHCSSRQSRKSSIHSRSNRRSTLTTHSFTSR